MSYSKSLFIGVLDRIFTFASYILTILIVYLLLENYFLLVFFGFLLILAIASIPILLKKLISIDNFYIRFTVDFLNSFDFYKIIFLGILNACLIGIAYLCILKSLGCEFNILFLPNILMGLLSNYIPISYSGWGVREVSLVELLKNTSCSDVSIFSGSVIFGLWGILISIPGLFFLPKYFRFKNMMKAK
jgi:hypothetical protein